MMFSTTGVSLVTVLSIKLLSRLSMLLGTLLSVGVGILSVGKSKLCVVSIVSSSWTQKNSVIRSLKVSCFLGVVFSLSMKRSIKNSLKVSFFLVSTLEEVSSIWGFSAFWTSSLVGISTLLVLDIFSSFLTLGGFRLIFPSFFVLLVVSSGKSSSTGIV